MYKNTKTIDFFNFCNSNVWKNIKTLIVCLSDINSLYKFCDFVIFLYTVNVLSEVLNSNTFLTSLSLKSNIDLLFNFSKKLYLK
ncbi:hypothetical protein CWI36_0254p0010 [Hamiltosporidium magnivora]|uniref:Uncharacterized protein n=1 Tax=Hamiltosporidium magnivora TaxID=148818 RepID=A0A4Q9LJW7_9MICR|nr:hypothetical protein CWI36_0254p0010 [Hamiltosporidium magnivora]